MKTGGLTMIWLQRNFYRFFRMPDENTLLVWDSYKCHISDEVKQKAKSLEVDWLIVPGGCTGKIQIPDVSWNKPFKQSICCGFMFVHLCLYMNLFSWCLRSTKLFYYIFQEKILWWHLISVCTLKSITHVF